MPRFAAAVTAFALGAALSGAAAADPTIYYLETGHTGAQTQIDTNHTTSWSYNATWGWTLGGGNFVMKDGSATTADVALTVYEGTSASGTLVAQLTLNNGQFCTIHQNANCQTFATTEFHFASPYTFTAGSDYYVALTSTAPDVQSEAYFIKGADALTFLDASNNTLPTQAPTTDAPEPGSLALLLAAAAGIAGARRRARG